MKLEADDCYWPILQVAAVAAAVSRSGQRLPDLHRAHESNHSDRTESNCCWPILAFVAYLTRPVVRPTNNNCAIP